jgi:hypothetical protein
MFFKKKLSVASYLQTRLDLLFSKEQTNLWLELKQSWPESSISSADSDLFLTHLRAAHIEVISMVVTKKLAGNFNMFIEMQDFIEDYLVKHNEPYMKELLPLYSKALASIPTDGILGIATFLADCISGNNYTEQTVMAFGSQLYHAVESIRADLKDIKLVSNT